MDSLEKEAYELLNKGKTNNSLRTSIIYNSEPLGFYEGLLELGKTYHISDNLPPLICVEIIDYESFLEYSEDPVAQAGCKKVAFFHYDEKKAKKYKKTTSQKQEKTLAKKLGGKLRPGSGALSWFKGDVITESFLVEAKYTDSLEYRLTLQTWNKIKNEAYSYDKIPLMEVCLNQDDIPVKIIIINPMDLYDKTGIDEEQLQQMFKILNIDTEAKSINLKYDIIKPYIEDINYNHEGMLPAFSLSIGATNLIAIETEDFIRIIND